MIISFLSSINNRMAGLKTRAFCSLLLCTFTILLFCYFASTKNLFVIMDGLDLRVLNTYQTDPHAALSEAGIQVAEGDSVSLPEGPVSGAAEVIIDRSHSVAIEVDGKTLSYSASGDTVLSALQNAGVRLGSLDEVSPPVETPITEDTSIKIVRIGTQTETLSEEIPFETVRNPSIYINKGTEIIKQEGKTGSRTSVFEISLRDGEEVGRRTVSEDVVIEPVSQVIEYGCGGTITTKDGRTLSFKRVIDGQATAYTTEGYTTKNNAIGNLARPGTIAVDPRVIPLRSKVYVTSPNGTSWIYGEAIAEDTGGAIKGNIIDLYFDTRAECFDFGRRRCKIYILE